MFGVRTAWFMFILLDCLSAEWLWLGVCWFVIYCFVVGFDCICFR